jgi:hypothetical protein
MSQSDRGENSRFQMFSKEGNDALKSMCDTIILDAECGKISRKGLAHEILHHCDMVQDAGFPEVWDTEPQWAISDELTERLCKPQMWLPIIRGEW